MQKGVRIGTADGKNGAMRDIVEMKAITAPPLRTIYPGDARGVRASATFSFADTEREHEMVKDSVDTRTPSGTATSPEGEKVHGAPLPMTMPLRSRAAAT
jgi:hypothetical protein